MSWVASPSFSVAARSLAAIGRTFYARGWVMGTSGNFSIVRSRSPWRQVISASSVPKGQLTAKDFLEVDAHGRPLRESARPSAETLLHVDIARHRGALAVLHTHSVAATVLSTRHAAAGGLAIEGLEMLKGLAGVTTHQHREWVPIIENDQDMRRLSRALTTALDQYPAAHGVLLAGHGLYTWGDSLADAERHVEILEFLLDVTLRLE